MLRASTLLRPPSKPQASTFTRVGALGLATFVVASCSEDPTQPPGDPGVSEVSFDPTSIQIFEGESRDLAAMVTLRAADGEELEDREIEWLSSDPSVVSVDADGLALGESQGAAQITATSEGITGELPVQVEEAPELRIDSIEPDSLEDGGTAVLHGEGFHVPDLQVTVAGARTTIIEAEEERAEVEVSSVCRPRGDVEVMASILDGRVTDGAEHPYVGGEPLDMEAGEFRYLADPEDFCLLFEEESFSEEYAFGVQSTLGAGALTPVRVSAGAVDDGSLLPLAAASPSAQSEPGTVLGQESAGLRAALAGHGPAAEAWHRHHRAEMVLRERDRRFVQQGSAGGEPAVAADVVAAQEQGEGSIPPDVSQGDTVEIRVPDLDESSFCQEYVSITTVAEVVGNEGVFLVDVNNPDDGFGVDDWADLSDRFDSEIHPALEEHFGEATDLDGTGRIALVASREVNDLDEAPLGFVVSCDFVPRDNAAASDFGEIFYVRAPMDGDFFSPDRARTDLPRLLAHEATHVIQLGRRVTSEQPFPTDWELEGQAVLGEEVAGHRAWGHGAREDLSVGQVAIEEDDEGTLWYLNAFFDLFTYFGLQHQDELGRVEGAPEECSWLERNVEGEHGAPCEMGRREPYGVAWSFLRWVADQFDDELPGGEATFHQELIDSGDVGFPNVEGIVGEPAERLLAEWAASLYADNRFAGDGDSRIDFPSWDLSEIDDIRAGDDTEVALQPRERDFETFEDEFQVRGGSSAYYLISGSSRPSTGVRATTLEGGFLPSAMQMWVVRLE